MQEVWKTIKETTRSKWKISNLGNVVRYDKRKRIYVAKTFTSDGQGYYKFMGKRLHQWVATVFIDNPQNKKCVNHLNGIKIDNRVENLEWVTHSENTNHAIKIGLISKDRLVELAKSNAQKVKGKKRNTIL